MGRRSKQSKDKRKSERERQKRWGQQQKALHENQLYRDLTYYDERGLFASQAKWSETASQVLWDSQDWRGEPEFHDLTFDPYQVGQAMHSAWEELKFDPAEFEKLSDDDKEDQNFELNACAIRSLMSQEIKKDLLRRLERYRLRLRSDKQWEALAQAALVQLVLETSEQAGEESAWPECMLIYQIHYEAVGEYLRLQEAAETALDQALQTLGHDFDTPDSHLTETERAQITETIEQVARRTPGLPDFLERAADDLVDEALDAVRHGELCYDLFTREETNSCSTYFLSALIASGASKTMPKDLSPQERAKVDEQVNDAIADCLDEIDTPQRRAELYASARAALQQQQAQEDITSSTSRAELLLPFLDDTEVPLADNEFFVAAITGEFGVQWDAEAEADDSAEGGEAEI